jgi:hypothetical protein
MIVRLRAKSQQRQFVPHADPLYNPREGAVLRCINRFENFGNGGQP